LGFFISTLLNIYFPRFQLTISFYFFSVRQLPSQLDQVHHRLERDRTTNPARRGTAGRPQRQPQHLKLNKTGYETGKTGYETGFRKKFLFIHSCFCCLLFLNLPSCSHRRIAAYFDIFTNILISIFNPKII
jgi:hypothetical protein